jgi:hypothetical protein
LRLFDCAAQGRSILKAWNDAFAPEAFFTELSPLRVGTRRGRASEA